MGFDASQAFRYSADQMLAVPSVLGVAVYQVYSVIITNDQVDFGDTSVNRIVSKTRIVIADGYRSYAGTPDGYLNPLVKQPDGQTMVLANGQLSTNELLVGPLVFPYSLNGLTAGYDPLVTFQPPLVANSNTQTYLQIQGIGLSSTSNFFKIREIALGKGYDSNILYRLVVEATGINVV